MLVGAYAAAPATSSLEPVYWSSLTALPAVGGWELPIVSATGALHATDEAAMLDALIGKAAGDVRAVVVTCIPATMAALTTNCHFGLASDDDAGRRSAVALAAATLEAVHRHGAAVSSHRKSGASFSRRCVLQTNVVIKTILTLVA